MRVPRTTLRPHPSSVGAARRFVADVLASRDFAEESIERAMLLTSEIITDAMARAGTEVELEVVADHPMVRVEVHNLATFSDHHDGPGGAYRLRLLHGLSEAWGVDEMGVGGSSTWFEIRS
jgi:hypothetical protein